MNNLPLVSYYNKLSRQSLTPITKMQIRTDFKDHLQLGKVLAHLVNFKLYHTKQHKDIVQQNNELESLKSILGDTPEFEQAQLLVRNRNVLVQRQLPNQFKQIIIDLINNGGTQFLEFLYNLVPASEEFLLTNNINLARDKLRILTKNLDNWVNEAPEIERNARLTAQSKILHAYYSNSKHLDLGKLQLTTLPKEVFIFLTYLEQLDLSHNQLDTLPKEVFNFLIYLEQLGSAKTQIIPLPDEIFYDLDHLEQTELSHNRPGMNPPNLFNGLTNLKGLNLSNNQLSTLPAEIFNGLANLQWLDLSNNDLSTLPDGIFNVLTNLEWLNLEYNRLQILSKDLFKGLKKLNHVRV